MGEFVNPSQLSAQYPETPGNTTEARQLVSEKFQRSADMADSLVNRSTDALEELWDYVKGISANMPSIDIDYDTHDLNIDSGLAGDRPTRPTVTTPSVTAPQAPDLLTPTVKEVTIPSGVIEAPGSEGQFNYDEGAYLSDIHDAVVTKLLYWIENGGTGLGATVEDAIWDRDNERNRTQRERVYQEKEEYFASRGWNLPPGALEAAVSEALLEQTRADDQRSREIAIAQAELAQKNTHYFFTESTKYEGILREHFNQVATRALEAAKAAVEKVWQIYTAKLEGRRIELEIARTEAEVNKTQAEVITATNAALTDRFDAEIRAFDSKLKLELTIIEMIAKVFSMDVEGYRADIEAAKTQLQAEIEVLRAKVQQSNNQTALSIQEAQMLLEAYLKATGIEIEGIGTSGKVLAQLAGAALSAVSTSAGISYSVSRGRSDGVRHSTSVSNQAGLNESHSFNESEA
jgi:G:T/U-mismatch repair DNA glycosylase